MEKIKYYLEIIRDAGVILGVPLLIYVGVSLQNKQIEMMEAQLKLAETLTYDKALQMIESQEHLYKKEIAKLTEIQKEKLKSCVGWVVHSESGKDFDGDIWEKWLEKSNKTN